MHWLGAPLNNITGFNADSEHSVETLLAVANWFAAPFGTAEYLFTKYGSEGEQYELAGTDPIPTGKGVLETGIGLQYIRDSTMAYYFPGDATVPERQYAVQELMAENLSQNAAYGLASPTLDEKGGDLTSPVLDAMSQIAQGNRFDLRAARRRRDLAQGRRGEGRRGARGRLTSASEVG